MALAVRSTERRLVVVIGAVVFVDMMFYAAITPLLPALARELHLSKLSAGVLTAAYPLGTLLGSLPGGVLTVRVGPKRTMYAGLSLLAGATLAFGWLDNLVLLDLARFVEGVGSALSWSAGLAWLVADVPASRRGARIGGALSAAVAGMLFGPVIGTLADAVGRGPAFSAVVVLSIILIDQARRLPLHHSPSGQGVRHLAAAMRHEKLLLATWLVALPAGAGGVLNVLGPLRLHGFGATAGAIGATYLACAAAETVISPVVGRLSDRRGRLLPVRLGLAASVPLLLCFTLPSSAAGLAALIVLTAGALGTFWAPAMAMLSDAADHLGLDQGLAAAAVNLAWAAGMVVGGLGGGAAAKAAGDGLPMIVAAGLCAVTLAGLVRRGGGRRAALSSEVGRAADALPGR